MVRTSGLSGRAELKCVFCDKLDSLRMEAAKWADGPLATGIAGDRLSGETELHKL
ncbi:hypothetical protein JQ600_34155 [Bradyrhizobium sp. AUGA SZCCT0176]|uniref:hypothetical protein n=1 Tax=Bradyrhizobium sp. AUGA SZCCT0176 TaxID=2807664 RepID=UPI001BA5D1A5|nr:hypothetical protein [Bradyrhizobium sp. AUGA SZCCT0176]MBR1229941.1 hypothetical protein [Bradyrhizobium sp. AUGA SZCCT0176]